MLFRIWIFFYFGYFNFLAYYILNKHSPWATIQCKAPPLTNYTCIAWAGGTFFQLCCCVSFLVVAEIVLGDTYLPYRLCRCVFFFVAARNSFWLHRSVFLLWREIVLGVTSVPTIPVVPLCQFFGCGGK